MPKIEMEITLPVGATQLSNELLDMKGVNDELWPYLKMTGPNNWYEKPIKEWPINQKLFTSKILFLGVLPIDAHCFKFESVSSTGFKEFSKTLLNSAWHHERSIVSNGSNTILKDVVYYQSRCSLLGSFLKPFYQVIFTHRHKRLKGKYV